MKIAIVGAPGSGKTELAEGLEKYLRERCPNCTTAVIDDYVDEIGKQNDIAIGGDATYIGNLYIVLGRLTHERKAESDGAKHTITCGTIVESSVYTTIEAVRQQTQPHFVRATNLMNLLGSIFQDAWQYDHVFVLSLEESDLETIEGQVDQALFMALSSFSVPFTPLNGSFEEKLSKAKEELNVTLAPSLVN
jgi:hypothetical protein